MLKHRLCRKIRYVIHTLKTMFDEFVKAQINSRFHNSRAYISVRSHVKFITLILHRFHTPSMFFCFPTLALAAVM